MRLTKNRKLVFNVFKDNNTLLCAEDINRLLTNDLSTIYRALNTLHYLKYGDHHFYDLSRLFKTDSFKLFV